MYTANVLAAISTLYICVKNPPTVVCDFSRFLIANSNCHFILLLHLNSFKNQILFVLFQKVNYVTFAKFLCKCCKKLNAHFTESNVQFFNILVCKFVGFTKSFMLD